MRIASGATVVVSPCAVYAWSVIGAVAQFAAEFLDRLIDFFDVFLLIEGGWGSEVCIGWEALAEMSEAQEFGEAFEIVWGELGAGG